MLNDYPESAWSLTSLSIRLQCFSIYYTNYTIAIETVSEAVSAEIQGPYQSLGYRAMNHKLCTEHVNIM